MTAARTYTRWEDEVWSARRSHARAWDLYLAALAEFEEVQAALAERLLAGEEPTPEERLRDSTARQTLDNTRTLVWSFPLV